MDAGVALFSRDGVRPDIAETASQRSRLSMMQAQVDANMAAKLITSQGRDEATGGQVREA